jgi:hypothetical protein
MKWPFARRRLSRVTEDMAATIKRRATEDPREPLVPVEKTRPSGRIPPRQPEQQLDQRIAG